MKVITLKPIGIIYMEYTHKEGMPIQPSGSKGVEGVVELYPEFVDGLKDLDGFSHIILLYHLHLSADYKLIVKPFMDEVLRGVFATRAPKRPNPIGLSVVKLNKIENNKIFVENVDMINETPLLDIKPYIPDVDSVNTFRLGWLEGKTLKMKDEKSDSRFSD
jgi:tRNA-Thr(GGU) m(6)t(6)A37 methyltransferase TsaA